MKLILNYIIILLIAVLSLFSSCKNDKEKVAQKTKKAPLVKIQAAQKSKMVSYIDITGTLQENIYTDITSPADGIIESLMARENQQVVKDKIIAVINPNERVTLISNNQLEVGRLEKKIHAIDKNSEEYKELVQHLEKAKDNLAYARKMYQTIPVICPMSGLVTKRWLDIGSQVGAKEKILTISDMKSLVIKAEVNEKYFEAIKKGKKLPLQLNAYPNDSLMGVISLIYPEIKAETRSISFDIKILNFQKQLLPGMMATITLVTETHENALVVPDDALLTDIDNKPFLYQIDKDMVAHKMDVVPGLSSKGLTEIVSGLSENDQIVVKGQEMLKEGVKVMVAKSKNNSQK